MQTQLSYRIGKGQGEGRLNVGIDMGKSRWVMDVLDTASGRHHRYTASGEQVALDTYERIKGLVSQGRDVDVIYEAGRNGFTPARVMRGFGATVTVVPVNRLKRSGRGKTAKTDRLDAGSLSEQDARASGFPSVWVPSVDQECRRRALREKERLEKEVKRANNRILGALERWPVPSQNSHRPASAWRQLLGEWVRCGLIPEFLPELEHACLENLVEELALEEKCLARWEERIDALICQDRQAASDRQEPYDFDLLTEYVGIGREITLGLSWYVGDFGRFSNGKKFGAYLGLVPTPWASGSIRREQGISKAGNPQVRRLLVELAWLWLRHQPDSPITRKWKSRTEQRGRSRKTAIVAVARQLAVAIYRLLRYGVPLEGARKKKPVASVPAAPPGSPLAA